jgi:AraC-like DNA-binding protein
VRRHADLKASLHHLPLGHMSLNRLRSGADVSIEPMAPQEDNFLVSLPVAGAASFRYGTARARLGPGVGSVIGPYRPFHFEISGEFDQIILRLDRRRVETICGALLRSETERPVDFSLALIDPLPGWTAVLTGAAALAAAYDVGQRPLLAANLEEFVIGTLLLHQPNSLSTAIRDAGRPALPVALRRAIDFMRAHMTEPLRLQDVADYAGVSLRSLQTGFRNRLGTSPSAWLREQRLQQVHDVLSAAPPGSTTVTEVALDWGFIHLGEFAARYRARFGVKPSDVLAKRR